MYAVLRHWHDWLPWLGLGIEDFDLDSDSEDLTTSLSDNWTFLVKLLQLSQYECKSVEVVVLWMGSVITSGKKLYVKMEFPQTVVDIVN